MRSSFVFYVQVVSDTKSEKTKSKKDEANGQAQSQAKASKGQGGRAHFSCRPFILARC